MVRHLEQFDLIGRAAAAAGITEARVRYWVRKGLVTTRPFSRHRERPRLVEVARVLQLATEDLEQS
jgi:hypothetical protein